jgi:hypothetical protein
VNDGALRGKKHGSPVWTKEHYRWAFRETRITENAPVGVHRKFRACPGRKYQSLYAAAQFASENGEVRHRCKKLVSQTFVIETRIFPPDFIPTHEGNVILKLISLSSYSYLTIELSFETILEIWQVLICLPTDKNRRRDSSKPRSRSHSLKVARKRRWTPCEPHQIWLSGPQVPARACRSSSL